MSEALSEDPLPQNAHQVFAIAILDHRLRQALEFPGGYVAHAKCDFLGTRDLQALTPFERLHEVRGVDQRVVCAGIQPRMPAPHHQNVKLVPLEISPIDIRDLQLASCRGTKSA